MSRFPDDDNGAILQCLADHRFNFDIEHPVDFFALIPSKEGAEAVAEEYRALQAEDESISDIETRPALDGKSTELVITKVMMVTYDNVKGFESALEKACRAHKGTTDGWGVLHDDEVE